MTVTRLEAVNTMLRTIGQVPVVQISTNGLSDDAIANEVLEEYNRELQSPGYDFNTNWKKTLYPNVNKNINVFDTVFSLKSHTPNRRFVLRKDSTDHDYFFLYDIDNETFEFDGPVEVDLILYRDFELIPELLQRYVIIRAARVFSHRTIGSAELEAFSAEDEARARGSWLEHVARTEELNLFSTSDHRRPRTFNPYNSIARY